MIEYNIIEGDECTMHENQFDRWHSSRHFIVISMCGTVRHETIPILWVSDSSTTINEFSIHVPCGTDHETVRSVLSFYEGELVCEMTNPHHSTRENNPEKEEISKIITRRNVGKVVQKIESSIRIGGIYLYLDDFIDHINEHDEPFAVTLCNSINLDIGQDIAMEAGKAIVSTLRNAGDVFGADDNVRLNQFFNEEKSVDLVSAELVSFFERRTGENFDLILDIEESEAAYYDHEAAMVFAFINDMGLFKPEYSR